MRSRSLAQTHMFLLLLLLLPLTTTTAARTNQCQTLCPTGLKAGNSSRTNRRRLRLGSPCLRTHLRHQHKMALLHIIIMVIIIITINIIIILLALVIVLLCQQQQQHKHRQLMLRQLSTLSSPSSESLPTRQRAEMLALWRPPKASSGSQMCPQTS